MSDLISRQAAIDAILAVTNFNNVREMLDYVLENNLTNDWIGGVIDSIDAVIEVDSAQPEIIRCKDCKHNPKYEWFGCPMSHLNEKQRPETAWCWKAEARLFQKIGDDARKWKFEVKEMKGGDA